MRYLALALLGLAIAGCASNPPVPDDAGTTLDGTTGCPEGEACDADGDGCTIDRCEGGVCVVDRPAGCDDGDSCTEDICVPTGPTGFSCEHEASTRTCTIEGTCFADGTANPDNTCLVCDVTDSSSMWSSSTAECDDGDACTTNDRCMDGVCAGDPQEDADEPNDTPAEATPLADVRDSDDFPAATREGRISSEEDEDFFRFSDMDVLGGLIYPRIELDDIPEGANYDLCAFLECSNGDTAGAGCDMGDAARFNDMQGCCSNNPGNEAEVIRLSPMCSGTDDSVDVLVRVRFVEGEPSCGAPYTLTHGDD